MDVAYSIFLLLLYCGVYYIFFLTLRKEVVNRKKRAMAKVVSIDRARVVKRKNNKT